MRNGFGLTGLAATLALSVSGCALDGASTDEEMSDAAAVAGGDEEFAYVDKDVEEGTETKKVEEEESLSAKSIWTEHRARGQFFHKVFTVAQGKTLVCSTSSGSSDVDTILAVLQCESSSGGGNVWNTACLSNDTHSGYYNQYGYKTLAFNDDWSGHGHYSRVEYKNNDVFGGATVHVVGFAYDNDVGTATVSCDNGGTKSTKTNATFWSGTTRRRCDEGRIQFTTNGAPGDTSLLAIDPTVGGTNSRSNEDIASGNLLSRLSSLPNDYLYYVHGQWNNNDNGTNEWSYLKCD